MIIDFNSYQVPQVISFDICIIGAGAAGLSIAASLLDLADTQISLVECGGMQQPENMQSGISAVSNSGDIESALPGSRLHGFGGSTQTWGGQALPFTSLDFSTRPWINQASWPIEESDLSPYYAQVEGLFQVDNTEYSADIWASNYSLKKNKIRQTFVDSGLRLGFSKFSPQPNFAKSIGQDIISAKHVSKLLNARVTELVPDQSGQHIEFAMVSNQHGETFKLEAKTFILCAGGIENVRILLNSEHHYYKSFGKKNLPLGQYYQDHIGFYGAKMLPLDRAKFNALFATKLNQRQKFLPKISLSESVQSATMSLNVVANIEVQSNAYSGQNRLRNIYHSVRNGKLDISLFKDLLAVIRTPKELFEALLAFFLQRQIYIPQYAEYYLIANCESEPMQQSQISLSDEVDDFGMRKADIKWLVNDRSRTTMLQFYTKLQKKLKDANIAELEIKQSLFENSDEWKKSCYGLYHHMGATRMSALPENGVVDADCKVHGLDNLYIAGTSVLPIGGAANPTFTALALALRMADHLKRQQFRDETVDPI